MKPGKIKIYLILNGIPFKSTIDQNNINNIDNITQKTPSLFKKQLTFIFCCFRFKLHKYVQYYNKQQKKKKTVLNIHCMLHKTGTE